MSSNPSIQMHLSSLRILCENTSQLEQVEEVISQFRQVGLQE